MATRNQHVILHEGKWAVQSEGSRKIASVYDTKQKAIDAAREIASREGVDVLVHGRTGQIFRKPAAPSRFTEDEIRVAIRELASKSRNGSQRAKAR
jgi:hypothetical protein